MTRSTTPTSLSDRRLPALLLPAVLLLIGGGAIAAMVSTTGTGDTREATVPPGTVFVAALDRTVSTKVSAVGERVQLETTEPVSLGPDIVIPVGAMVRGEVTHAKGGGRIAGAPELTLRFTELESDGERYRIDAEPFRVRGKSDGVESAAEIGGGAVAGGILGGVLGGGGGAVKGALAGAAIGTGVAIVTDGDDLVLPAGTRLKIALAAPLTVTYRPDTGE